MQWRIRSSKLPTHIIFRLAKEIKGKYTVHTVGRRLGMHIEEGLSSTLAARADREGEVLEGGSARQGIVQVD